MSKHDTWATLTRVNPLSEVIHLFPDYQIPMCDPFPMELVANGDNMVALFTIDIERLSSRQIQAIANIYAEFLRVPAEAILADAAINRGFGINSLYVDRLFCGPEGYQRTKEITDFYDEHPNPTVEQIVNFMEDQRNRWVEGDEQPLPMPEKFEDFDPRMQTPDLEEALNQREIAQHFTSYSAFDILMGNAMIDFLNKQDPDVQYESVGLEELLEDE